VVPINLKTLKKHQQSQPELKHRNTDLSAIPNFPKKYLQSLLHQKYVELNLVHQSHVNGSYSFSYADNTIVVYDALRAPRKAFLENEIQACLDFLNAFGYELISEPTTKANKNNSENKSDDMLQNNNNGTNAPSIFSPQSSASQFSSESTRFPLSPVAQNSIIGHRLNNIISGHWLDYHLDRISVPHDVSPLVPELAEYLHDRSSLENSKNPVSEKNSYLTQPWQKLPWFAKNSKLQEAVVLIKGIVSAGFYIASFQQRTW